MRNEIGKKIWAFADGELPPAGGYAMQGHESVIILNTSDDEAAVQMTLFFTDQDPIVIDNIKVGAERVKCVRMDHSEELSGYSAPRELQYAILLESNVPVVVQYGRLDTREQPLAFITSTGYSV